MKPFLRINQTEINSFQIDEVTQKATFREQSQSNTIETKKKGINNKISSLSPMYYFKKEKKEKWKCFSVLKNSCSDEEPNAVYESTLLLLSEHWTRAHLNQNNGKKPAAVVHKSRAVEETQKEDSSYLV